MLTPRQQLIYETLDHVWEIHQGKKLPTYEESSKRLAALGHSKGSPNEFYKYRPRWMEERGYADPKTQIEPLPDPIEQATNALRRKILEEAEEKIKGYQSDYETKLAELHKENTRIAEALATLTQEHELLKTHYQTQTFELEDSKKLCEITSELLAQAESDIIIAQKERDAIQTESENWREVSQQSLKEIREINAQQCEQFAAALKEVSETYQNRLSETREHMEEQHQQDAVKLVNANAENQKLTQQLDKLRSEKQVLETEKTVLTVREQQLNELLNVKTETIESLKVHNNTLSNELLQQQNIFGILKPLEKNMEAMLIHQADSKKIYSHLLQTLKEQITRSKEVQT
jgi:chromosome segregation ATPase